MKSKEELLVPRYKVSEQGYPCMPFEPNEILLLDQIDKDNIFKTGYFFIRKARFWYESFLKSFPSIFRKLEWWEERSIEDMPEYVMNTTPDNTSQYHKVKQWHQSESKWEPFFAQLVGDVVEDRRFSIAFFQPATFDEYNAFVSGT